MRIAPLLRNNAFSSTLLFDIAGKPHLFEACIDEMTFK